MITVNLFTSGRHTQPLIEALKKAKEIKLVNIYKKLPDLPDKTNVFLVADFGQIVPKKILEMPRHGSLCVHPSLLPKYRGASPVQHAILNGEKETGVTITKMDEKIDHGPIIAQFKEEIRDGDTAETLYGRLFALGARDLINLLPAYIKGKIKPREQNHKKATYTKILTRDDGKIDWGKSDEEIERFIRAMYPWPGAWIEVRFTVHGSQFTAKRLKILKAHLEKSLPTIPDREPRKKPSIADYQLLITKLVLDLVQLEGKRRVTWKQFKEGYPEAKFA